MDERERAANMSAEFYSDDLGELVRGEGDREGALPAIKVAGVLVFVYTEGGLLRVSVDLDNAREYWPEGWTVPLEITVQGVTVYEAASEREGDGRPVVPLVTVGERAEGQWFAYQAGGMFGPFGSAEEAWGEVADGRYVCDEDWERITGLRAECQDDCSLPLDHHGPCGPRKHAGDPEACELCGTPGRLTLFER